MLHKKCLFFITKFFAVTIKKSLAIKQGFFYITLFVRSYAALRLSSKF